MKIGPTNAIPSKLYQTPSTPESNGLEGDFQSHLRHSLRAADSMAHTASVLGGIAAAAPVAALPPSPAGARDRMVAQLERLLDDLSVLHARLNAPEPDSEPAGPLIEKLAAAREHLTGAAGSLPDDDPLNPLMNQALILTATELIKFRRGDYG